MNLSQEQKHVARKLIRVGKRMGRSKKDILTALVTGLTEASLTNPSSGDGTSVGWRQEIDSYGSVKSRRNIAQSAQRFYRELNGVHGSIGTRAQAVQRSAFPGRYAEHIGEAKAIYRQLAGQANTAQGKEAKGNLAAKAATQVGLTGAQKLSFVQSLDLTGESEFSAQPFLDYAAAKKTATAITATTKKSAKSKSLSPKGNASQKGVGKIKPAKVAHVAGKAIKLGTKGADKFGLSVTSTTGGTHVSGSYHYQRRAIDVSGSPKEMKKFFMWARKFKPTELFYDPVGYYYKNGSRIRGAIGDHSDHVHFAL